MKAWKFVLSLWLLWLGTFFVALVCDGIYSHNGGPEFHWTEPVTLSMLLEGLKTTPFSEYFKAFYAGDEWICLLALLTSALILYLTRYRPKNIFRILLLMAQIIGGWAGMLMCVYVPYSQIMGEQRIDGEFFSEDWPLIMSFGFWSYCCIAILVLDLVYWPAKIKWYSQQQPSQKKEPEEMASGVAS